MAALGLAFGIFDFKQLSALSDIFELSEVFSILEPGPVILQVKRGDELGISLKHLDARESWFFVVEKSSLQGRQDVDFALALPNLVHCGHPHSVEEATYEPCAVLFASHCRRCV